MADNFRLNRLCRWPEKNIFTERKREKEKDEIVSPGDVTNINGVDQ